MSKVITKFDPELIRRAVNRIAEPVIQTLTPLGNNVMFEKEFHSIITNDGATIAKLIDSDDPTEDAIIQMVKYGSLATNQSAGDGTSTTILLTKKLVDMGLDQIQSGVKPMVLKQMYTRMKDSILKESESIMKKVSPEDWYNIALISSGGDETVAKNVVSIIETAGVDGMVFLNESKNDKTKITKDTGYNLEQPMVDPILGNLSLGRADYNKPYVFITDKKMYHVEECKEILETAYKFGAREVVIVARDFLGESTEWLIANHMDEKVPLKVLLIKYPTPDNDFTSIHDLATYLGGKVISEKAGSLKGKLNADDYVLAERVYSAGPKTIFVTDNKTNPELTMLIEDVRRKKEDNPDDQVVAKRLASLTAGTVNLEVGAPTGPELRELIYRYEDAINATRSAIRSGYVIGGGLSLYTSTRSLDTLAQDFGTASIKQIADNCGIEFEESQYTQTRGYNAKSGEFSDLEKDGVIEPYDVFKHSVTNAFSIAIAILTSGFFIVNKPKENV
jgi:chaperonin GroEL